MPSRGFDLERPVLRLEQSRMARAALLWSLEDAAAAAGVSRRTVLRFERYHRGVRPELLQAVRRAYEATRVRFLDKGPDAGDVVPPPLRVCVSRRLASPAPARPCRCGSETTTADRRGWCRTSFRAPKREGRFRLRKVGGGAEHNEIFVSKLAIRQPDFLRCCGSCQASGHGRERASHAPVPSRE
ncbi:MAG: helix-turn-helix domain-containing protein [Allosphingosinicella sp.]|uniref:helix-turn-helix domain-containing protein n=1 Tax=Allosphingosinicella sp. TaxID=2823234 RepID=UPI003925EF88